MSVQDRVQRYRRSGGASDLVRVEVLVPAANRAEILAHAAQFRRDHRKRKEQLQKRIDQAIERYGVRIIDNVDLSRLSNVSEKARVVGKALMERGDARAFVLGRQLLAAAG
ncbi:hypothetical protein [Devosia nitrariae]|uniref:Uncharacterized protein n=1 Tax=Devosia nitrariae TaxID=2071872 RepID=A0ABQ5W4W2_9HYPH|nr:hypothetical protein [Devosia nitrariae]GLQ54975.1 hypothetical protein GCM10010862_22340 [Devosia nitrariae]